MTEWKPQPGKPAMTRDGKTLVTDLECGIPAGMLWSPKMGKLWHSNGTSTLQFSLNLIEPTAAILAAHGIDADGKPVAKVGDAAPFDMAAHLQRQRDWSGKTFGPGPRTAGVIDHIRKELREIEADPTDISEWIDVVILALDGAWRAGYQPQQIIDALVAKQTKNEARNWPDWRTMSADKAIEHDRSGEVVADPAPAPPTRVDDRWFLLFERAFEGAMACGEYAPSAVEAMVAHALKAADLAFAEVAKREGGDGQGTGQSHRGRIRCANPA